ncbi:MAG: MFS transporter [Alphaproteobacteria bacterium]|nr:MFS transporter [Alphaproteobacteria bacterium]
MNDRTANGAEQFEEQPYGWVIIAVATLVLALAFGTNITVPVLVKPFEQEFGWSRAAISLAYTALTIGAAAGGLFWGSLSDKIGAKHIAMFGVVMLSGSLMLLGRQDQLWAIYVLYFVIGGFGFACLFAPLLALVGLWFNRRKGLAFGIVTAGGAIGQGVAPVILQMMISASDWRDAITYMGAGYFVVMIPLLLLLRPPPVLEASAAEVSRSDTNLWGLPHRISIPWLAFAGIFCCICMAVPIVHLVPLGIGLNLSPETAVSLLATLMISGFFGRLFFGSLADRIGALYTYISASFLQTVMVFWFTQTQSLDVLYVLSAVFGFGFAGVMTSLLICAREAAPLRITGFATALVATTGWIGMGIGSYQGGYLYDLTGDYTWSYGIAAISGFINLTIVLCLIWYRRMRTGGFNSIALQPG